MKLSRHSVTPIVSIAKRDRYQVSPSQKQTHVNEYVRSDQTNTSHTAVRLDVFDAADRVFVIRSRGFVDGVSQVAL